MEWSLAVKGVQEARAERLAYADTSARCWRPPGRCLFSQAVQNGASSSIGRRGGRTCFIGCRMHRLGRHGGLLG
ncbi:unnamed protein product [Sphacelaria rigidula]